MDAAKKTISDIFNGNRILEIPFFQRAYVWGENQWERLLDDMELVTSLKKPYFLGSVILKQQLTTTGHQVGDVRTLIDGQQRLTTLNIFFKVLALKTETNRLFERTFKLINDDLALWHNHNDIESFQKVLNLTKLEDIGDTDNILNSYNYFKKRIDPEKLDRQTILNNLMFVGIDLGVEEDEQQIFDTINSLGVRLTTAELLKNYFFNRDEVNFYNKYWKDIFESNEEIKKYWDKEITTGRLKRTFIDLFFYSYLQIKIQETNLKVKTEDKIEYSKVETLFESYKNFIKNYIEPTGLSKKNILEEIKDYAKIFKDNFDYEIINKELTPDYGIERINAIIFGLDTSTLISYALYALKTIPNEDERNALFELVESYVMRRMIIRATTKNYNQLFTDRLISNKILSKKQFQEFINGSSEKINFFPNNHDIKEGFNNSVLVNKQAAGIIYLLESKNRNREKQATQLLGISKYSLEHLMPKKWENHWSTDLNKEQKDVRNKKLKTLGNLAIITQSLNASIRDSDWQTKKTGIKEKKKYGLLDYSAGIETLAPYLTLQEWNENEIEKRANDLYIIAKDTWKFEEIND